MVTMRQHLRRRRLSDPLPPERPVVPDGLWVKCPRCRELVYRREFERLLRVCPHCGHHSRLSARQRIAALADSGTFTEWDTGLVAADPLGFVALGEGYAAKVERTSAATGEREALVTGRATVEGVPVALAVTEFGFLGASMGSVFGEKLSRLVEGAIDQALPVVTVSSSGGARMHEGIFALMQMAKTTAAFSRLAKARLPHVAVLVDPCYGGVTASYATTADVILAEPGAMIGFAGPRVIEQITRQKLPEGFQSAEFLLEHGMIDAIVPRRELPVRIAQVLRLLLSRHEPIAGQSSTPQLEGGRDR
jgi:acetyl-CoA carboxylase carboxyl transferase subunit beta